MAASSSIQSNSMKIQDGNYYCFESVKYGGKYISATYDHNNTPRLISLDMEQIEDVKKYGGMGVWKAKECAGNLFAFESRRFIVSNIFVNNHSGLCLKEDNNVTANGGSGLWKVKDFGEDFFSFESKKFSGKHIGSDLVMPRDSYKKQFELLLIDKDVKANRGSGLWRIRELGRNYWEVERNVAQEAVVLKNHTNIEKK